MSQPASREEWCALAGSPHLFDAVVHACSQLLRVLCRCVVKSLPLIAGLRLQDKRRSNLYLVLNEGLQIPWQKVRQVLSVVVPSIGESEEQGVRRHGEERQEAGPNAPGQDCHHQSHHTRAWNVQVASGVREHGNRFQKYFGQQSAKQCYDDGSKGREVVRNSVQESHCAAGVQNEIVGIVGGSGEVCAAKDDIGQHRHAVSAASLVQKSGQESEATEQQKLPPLLIQAFFVILSYACESLQNLR
mmetsp:Transcript_24716/g.53761  ORF Transcript_24716/g.53761 Transcript_24716/m.53761 type:complete len:245 (-) Transcript_24716:1700-2434(-)